MTGPIKFVAHSRRVLEIASTYGWRPGARYTNTRDIKHVSFSDVGFLDINWKSYDFARHLAAAKTLRPFITVARDVESIGEIDSILEEAYQLQEYTRHVLLVPKDPALHGRFDEFLPRSFPLGFSVPTKYGATTLAAENYDRPVHLLGGRPDVQRRFAELMPVASVDCNRFTLDAGFGDYFDGERFRPHPQGGYENCLHDSVANINKCWSDYQAAAFSFSELSL